MLLAESEEPAEALEVGKAFVQRFPGARPMETARVRRLMADCALRLGKGSVEEALANYQAALIKEMPSAEKIDVLARLIRLVGIERNQPDKATAVLKQVEEAVKNSKLSEDDVQAAYRRAVIAAADVRLWLIGQFRNGDVAQVDAVRFTRQYGNGFHRGVDSEEKHECSYARSGKSPGSS